MKIDLLIKKVNTIRVKAKQEGRFSLFHTEFISQKIFSAKNYKTAKYIYDIVLEHDKDCNISYKTGILIDKIIQSKEFVVGIHRENLNLNSDIRGITSSKQLDDIIENGLPNSVHISSNDSSSSVPLISKVVTPIVGLAGYINLVSLDKKNDSIILLAFPKIKEDEAGNIKNGLVNESLKIVDKSKTDIIYKYENKYIIRPEFILGAILSKNNGLDEFFTRDDFIKNITSNKKGVKA